MTSENERDLLRLASSLALRAGLPRPEGLAALPGGRNNRVYRVDSTGGPWLLKRYFSHPADTRDRLGAEYAFLTFAASLGNAPVPRPLAVNTAGGEALYQFIEGRALAPDEATWENVAQAIDFAGLLASAKDSPRAMALPTASEAYFTLDGHLDRIEERVATLGRMTPRDEVGREAQSFVRERLEPAWRRVRHAIESGPARGHWAGPGGELAGNERCISPSDFGFHNAIMTGSGRLCFLDFEYAGWDDPAKLVCDFFLQPRVPVPHRLMDDFLARLSHALGTGERLALRVRALMPAYRVKWCCILLGEFTRVSLERRRFSVGDEPGDDLRRGQLAKAVRLAASLDET